MAACGVGQSGGLPWIPRGKVVAGLGSPGRGKAAVRRGVPARDKVAASLRSPSRGKAVAGRGAPARKKKLEMTDEHIYRIFSKFIGFTVSLSDKIYRKTPQTVHKII